MLRQFHRRAWIGPMIWFNSLLVTLRTRTGEHLDSWLTQAKSCELPELQSFAAGIEKDKDAVKHGLTWWINNGMVEGHVTKLKLIRKTGVWQS